MPARAEIIPFEPEPDNAGVGNDSDTAQAIIMESFFFGMTPFFLCGGPRMGPVFGGMLLSGKKAAELVIGR